MSKKKSFYIDEKSRISNVKRKVFSPVIAGAMALVVVLLALVSGGLIKLPEPVNAFEVVCTQENDLGPNTEQANWKSIFGDNFYVQPDATGRTWTLQEALGSFIAFPVYQGESKDGETKEFIVNIDPKRLEKNANGADYQDQIQKLQNIRTLENCTVHTAGIELGNLFLQTSNLISLISQKFAVYAFDSGLVCSKQGDTGCFDLLSIIVGNSRDKGLLPALTDNVYMPLVVIVLVIAAGSVLYTGIIQRQFRKALMNFLWIIGVAMLGLLFLLKPDIVARAPMAATNVASACVIGAFSGQNCFTSIPNVNTAVNITENTSKNICESSASQASMSMDDRISMTVNSLSCSIWKAFVLEPYSQGSFGKSFVDLDVSETNISSAIKAAGYEPSQFCIKTHTDGSVKSQGEILALDGNGGGAQICNLASYQMFLQTKASYAGSMNTSSGNEVDPRWYRLILTISHDDALWDKWNVTNADSKLSMGIVSFLTTVLGSILIVVISFFALIYYLLSVIMIAFAPLFLLIGLHPTRGRSLMLGWVENLLSNILKYIASAIFLLVSLAFYGAVLSAADNPILSLVFVVILTGALLMYRKELVDMIGKVNMGGQQFTTNVLGKVANKAKEVATHSVGSAVGVAAAGGSSAKIVAGFRDGVHREFKKGNSLTSNIVREYDKVQADNVRDIGIMAKTANNRKEEVAGRVDQAREELHQSEKDVTAAQNDYLTADLNLQKEKIDQAKLDDIKTEILANLPSKFDTDEFKEYMELDEEIDTLNADLQIAMAKNDGKEAARLKVEIQGKIEDKDALEAEMGTAITSSGVKYVHRNMMYLTNKEGIQERYLDKNAYNDARVAQAVADYNYDQAIDEQHRQLAEYADLDAQYAKVEVEAEEYTELHKNFVPGSKFTITDRKKKENAINKKAEQSQKDREEIRNSKFKEAVRIDKPAVPAQPDPAALPQQSTPSSPQTPPFPTLPPTP